MTKSVDITGQKFGMWFVIRDSLKRTKAGKVQFICRCECGNENIVTGGNLRSGLSRSCGCDKDKKTSARFIKHGLSKHPMFSRYSSMMARCYDKSNNEYKNYGARGITVCDRWKNSAADFIADIGIPPSASHTMDRINNNGNYCPENFRWATKKEQAINRRVTTMLEHNGVEMCCADWGRSLGMTKKAVFDRLRAGWPIDFAVTTPPIDKGMHERGKPWQLSQGVRKKSAPG